MKITKINLNNNPKNFYKNFSKLKNNKYSKKKIAMRSNSNFNKIYRKQKL